MNAPTKIEITTGDMEPEVLRDYVKEALLALIANVSNENAIDLLAHGLHELGVNEDVAGVLGDLIKADRQVVLDGLAEALEDSTDVDEIGTNFWRVDNLGGMDRSAMYYTESGKVVIGLLADEKFVSISTIPAEEVPDNVKEAAAAFLAQPAD